MKNKKNLIILIVAVVLIVGFIFYNQNNKSNNKTKNKKDSLLYEITYNENSVPGSIKNIKIYDNKVEIITNDKCTLDDCVETEEKETFNYSKENIDKLKKFIDSNFTKNGSNTIELNNKDLTARQKEVIQGLLLGENFLEVDIEEYKYKLEYSKSDETHYVVYFKDDNSILVKKLNINEDYDIEKIETYSLNFSKENINLLTNYIEKESKNQNKNIIYKYATLKKDEINIINSIVENQESYLDKLQDEPKLMYTITYHGLNCETPILYLYSDNTYEYYYTFSTNNEKLNAKTGTYNYDITKIINNIDKYKEDSTGPYSIKDANGTNYSTYITNIELKEFLSSIDVSLSKCLIQQ